ncbi:MAG: hypothetical protein K1X64_18840 [Myxococcaceae bacterium]|nr:hypothetical protein [Myxococcaceae bacterium]
MPKSKSDRALAKALGVSLSSFQESRASGRIPADERDVERLRATWLASSNSQGPAPMAARAESKPAGSDSGETLADARRRKEIALADLREDELAKKRGELIPAAEIEAGLIAEFSAVRTHLLAIPTRAKQVQPDLTVGQLATLDALIREALTELSERKHVAVPEVNP